MRHIKLRVTDQGELLVRSPTLMKGYWKDPEATAATFDAEGWMRTGDLAEIVEGRVFIRGRLKEIVVLSNGENINPEPVEGAILHDPHIAQVCVLGDRRPFLVAVAVLDEGRWQTLAAERGLDPSQPNAPAAKGEVQKLVAAQLRDFPKIAQVRRLHLTLEPWTVEEGLLTPTLKVKRHAIAARYEAEIAALYDGASGG